MGKAKGDVRVKLVVHAVEPKKHSRTMPWYPGATFDLISKDGFKESEKGAFGPGVYTDDRVFETTQRYGECISRNGWKNTISYCFILCAAFEFRKPVLNREHAGGSYMMDPLEDIDWQGLALPFMRKRCAYAVTTEQD